MPHPAEGDTAPDFTLHTDAGKSLTLSSLRGTPVVLFFYPKDDTPTCTKEACEFRDVFPKFSKTKGVVLGISPDDVKSHVKFKKKFALPYTLLADVDKSVSEAYGVWAQKSLFGHKYMGVLRTTFVIDREGKVAKVFEKVKAKGHAAAVMKIVATL